MSADGLFQTAVQACNFTETTAFVALVLAMVPCSCKHSDILIMEVPFTIVLGQ